MSRALAIKRALESGDIAQTLELFAQAGKTRDIKLRLPLNEALTADELLLLLVLKTAWFDQGNKKKGYLARAHLSRQTQLDISAALTAFAAQNHGEINPAKLHLVRTLAEENGEPLPNAKALELTQDLLAHMDLHVCHEIRKFFNKEAHSLLGIPKRWLYRTGHVLAGIVAICYGLATGATLFFILTNMGLLLSVAIIVGIFAFYHTSSTNYYFVARELSAILTGRRFWRYIDETTGKRKRLSRKSILYAGLGAVTIAAASASMALLNYPLLLKFFLFVGLIKAGAFGILPLLLISLTVIVAVCEFLAFSKRITMLARKGDLLQSIRNYYTRLFDHNSARYKRYSNRKERARRDKIYTYSFLTVAFFLITAGLGMSMAVSAIGLGFTVIPVIVITLFATLILLPSYLLIAAKIIEKLCVTSITTDETDAASMTLSRKIYKVCKSIGEVLMSLPVLRKMKWVYDYSAARRARQRIKAQHPKIVASLERYHIDPLHVAVEQQADKTHIHFLQTNTTYKARSGALQNNAILGARVEQAANPTGVYATIASLPTVDNEQNGVASRVRQNRINTMRQSIATKMNVFTRSKTITPSQRVDSMQRSTLCWAVFWRQKEAPSAVPLSPNNAAGTSASANARACHINFSGSYVDPSELSQYKGAGKEVTSHTQEKFKIQMEETGYGKAMYIHSQKTQGSEEKRMATMLEMVMSVLSTCPETLVLKGDPYMVEAGRLFAEIIKSEMKRRSGYDFEIIAQPIFPTGISKRMVTARASAFIAKLDYCWEKSTPASSGKNSGNIIKILQENTKRLHCRHPSQRTSRDISLRT